MRIEAAIVREQGVDFTVVAVKPQVFSNQRIMSELIRDLSLYFRTPVVLSANVNGQIRYSGRKDIVHFLSHVHPSRLPWREYNISAA